MAEEHDLAFGHADAVATGNRVPQLVIAFRKEEQGVTINYDDLRKAWADGLQIRHLRETY